MCAHLVVIHFHLRPGGVRRVIESLLPALAAELGVGRVTIAAGGAPEPGWLQTLQAAMPAVPLTLRVEPTFAYTAEQRATAPTWRRRLRAAAGRVLAGADAVWLHNPGIARNLPLAAEVAREARERGIRAVFHHHDFWFEHRWSRREEFAGLGFRTLASVGRAVFPRGVVPVVINRADAQEIPGAILVPNPLPAEPAPTRPRVNAARRWLGRELGSPGPVWLYPARFLRRKNFAEAILLARWLRPEAWLVTTAAVSSAAEADYARRLRAAAEAGGWQVRFAAVAGRADAPSVAELMAAAEVVVQTSLQEGFGLPVIEAARARRPLLGRALPGISEDLQRLRVRTPHLYDELWIAPECLDVAAERRRRETLWRQWRRGLPRGLAKEAPELPASGPVPFSRLTLAGQLDVLARPAADTWAASRRWNRRLAAAAHAGWQPMDWPDRAAAAFAPARSARALASAFRQSPPTLDGAGRQGELIAARLRPEGLFPLLMEAS